MATGDLSASTIRATCGEKNYVQVENSEHTRIFKQEAGNRENREQALRSKSIGQLR
jgi:hypothetical protein